MDLTIDDLAPQTQQDDETMGKYDFRVIRDDEKPHVKFNDGDLAFTIEFRDKREGNGMLYSAAMFRSMTELSVEDFKTQYPVVSDGFWDEQVPTKPMENILREDWEKQLAGDILFNDGERIIKHNGELGMDYLLRSDTDLSKAEFLQAHPVTFDEPWTSEMADKFLAELGKRGLLHEQSVSA
jgi:hypothetical protein